MNRYKFVPPVTIITPEGAELTTIYEIENELNKLLCEREATWAGGIFHQIHEVLNAANIPEKGDNGNPLTIVERVKALAIEMKDLKEGKELLERAISCLWWKKGETVALK